MNAILENIYETGYVEDAEGNSINPFPVATPRETGTILYDLVQKHNFQKKDMCCLTIYGCQELGKFCITY
ncbi:MAG: hypothetical protein IGR93_04475 [Hydrococcus sp. C42_A2020_068]|uniref:hypothetical protein n=1 Tax=Pleurocapsa sp. PCC 7327 TaxID=118163 RepID=UPI0011870F9E|nr:hypothetical protein [Pleurocapsa sp. PCC 7327]MBF2019374.1 hypothetical protein [Hydrococcus sp. C42_A2020_068]